MYAKERSGVRGHALRRLAGAAALVVVCLVADAARAQSGKGDYIGGWSVAGDVGFALPNTDEYSDEFTWRLGVGYSPLPRFEIGLEFGRFETTVSQPEADGVPTHDIASGGIVVYPVSLALQLHIPVTGTLASFNLLAGAGYYFIDYEMDDAPRGIFSAGVDKSLPDQVVRDAWGLHAGAGLEYALTGWLSVTVEARYMFLAPEVTGTAKDGNVIDGSLDLNTWIFTGGIKVTF